MFKSIKSNLVGNKIHLGRVRFLSTPSAKPFDKVLVANRGEIALRVMKTCQKLGIRTVGIYSEVDKNSNHVKFADEAFCLNLHADNSPTATYLNQQKILEIIHETGAQAVHPGYGFLSENEGFASGLESNGITFIGPPAEAIRSMGSKSESKNIMECNGVPCTPGYHGEEQSLARIREESRKIGYPVMLKAVSGGGGKGMRIVYTEDDLENNLESCKREALSSFGDDRVLVEKYLVGPRHIEFQIFSDKYGNAVHLFERDCSVQRRHQKVLEEAPAPGFTSTIRKRMGEAAVNAAKAVNYVGAGTVEFMLDPAENIDKSSFYFMEMNTRLQVEHPVTEMVTDLDLVELQLRVAAGEPLPFGQDDVSCSGHSIEARIYAESPKNNFLPDSGKLSLHQVPESCSFDRSKDVRVDSGFSTGDEVSVFYDPMISKLIAKGKNRGEALNLLERSLSQYHIGGLDNNVSFVTRCVKTEDFQQGNVSTSFIPENEHEILSPSTAANDDIMQACAVASVQKILKEFKTTNPLMEGRKTMRLFEASSSSVNIEKFFVITEFLPTKFEVIKVAVKIYGYTEDNSQVVRYFTEEPRVSFTLEIDPKNYIRNSEQKTGWFDFYQEGEQKSIKYFDNGREFYAFSGVSEAADVDNISFTVKEIAQDFASNASASSENIITPMPGKITKVNFKEGDEVKEGDLVIVMEAMKMEHQIKAEKDGIVTGLKFEVGSFVQGQQVLCKIK
eukprot:maker-scaffold_18-snap-gene-1.3-mRNA-1 protein AED:0.04 eAED:0.04 QI:70/1/1/1/1/1/6/182/730